MSRPGNKKTVGESIIAAFDEFNDKLDRGEAIYGTRVERTPDGFTQKRVVVIPGIEPSKRPRAIRRRRRK